MTEEKTGFGPIGMVGAFVGGALAGGVAALLLAPRSGRETRKRIGDSVTRQKDRVTRFGSAAREAGSAAKEAFTEAMASH
ncbi:MAG TPA: YtxH domain-containing protein [Anaeromyxobacteraceae bacterium]|nr:YtxH domain-containing protein [Anaeromyxobacteraceae bacterium]